MKTSQNKNKKGKIFALKEEIKYKFNLRNGLRYVVALKGHDVVESVPVVVSNYRRFLN
jgi:hypothetical protein